MACGLQWCPDISPNDNSPSDSSPTDSSPNDSSPNTQFTECPFHRMHNSQNDSSPSGQFAEQTFHRKKEKIKKDGENIEFFNLFQGFPRDNKLSRRSPFVYRGEQINEEQ